MTTQTVQPSYHVGIVTKPSESSNSRNKIEIALIMVHYSLESIHFLGGTDVYFQASCDPCPVNRLVIARVLLLQFKTEMDT